MFLRHAFAVGMFLVKTDFYLHQLGYGHTVYRSVFAGLPCTCFILYLSSIGDAAAYVLILK